MTALRHVLLHGLCGSLLISLGAQAQLVCAPGIPPGNPSAVYEIRDSGTTVHDARTGLIWKRCEEGRVWDAAGDGGTGICEAASGGAEATKTDFTWSEALARAEGHSFAGHDDWRLPNFKELLSLVEECRDEPTINNHVFNATTPTRFWSSSPSAYTSYAWFVDFEYGYAYDSSRDGAYHIRLVRGGQSLDPLPEAGECGTAQGQATLSAPDANRCVVASTASGVTTNAGTFDWTCGGTVTTASCSAPRQFEVTSAAGANGTIAPDTAQAVTYGQATSFTVGAASGDQIASVSGCGGTLLGSTFTTAAITASCAVGATFAPEPVEGACGSAAGQASLMRPSSAAMCMSGADTGYAPEAGVHHWVCQGSSGGGDAQCEAPGANVDGGGTVTLAFDGIECMNVQAQLVAPPAGGPAGVTMPFGALDFALSQCAQLDSVIVRTTFSASLAGMSWWKRIGGEWQPMPAEIAGHTASFIIVDNGPFDADPQPDSIADPSGPGHFGNGGATPIPTLTQWASLLLAGALGLLSIATLRRRR